MMGTGMLRMGALLEVTGFRSGIVCGLMRGGDGLGLLIGWGEVFPCCWLWEFLYVGCFGWLLVGCSFGLGTSSLFTIWPVCDASKGIRFCCIGS
jgi:hypothetical protein